MPLALNPNANFEVFLASDADTPESERPTFIFKYLCCRDWRKQAEISDLLNDKQADPEHLLQQVYNAIRLSLIDWRNMPGKAAKPRKYTPKKLEDILVPGEAIELLLAAIAQAPTQETPKKSLQILKDMQDDGKA